MYKTEKKKKKKPSMVTLTSHPCTWEAQTADLYGFKASLVYILSSKPAGTTYSHNWFSEGKDEVIFLLDSDMYMFSYHLIHLFPNSSLDKREGEGPRL